MGYIFTHEKITLIETNKVIMDDWGVNFLHSDIGTAYVYETIVMSLDPSTYMEDQDLFKSVLGSIYDFNDTFFADYWKDLEILNE